MSTGRETKKIKTHTHGSCAQSYQLNLQTKNRDLKKQGHNSKKVLPVSTCAAQVAVAAVVVVVVAVVVR